MAANLGVERFKTVPLFHAPAHILVVSAQREPLAHTPGPAPSPANSQMSRCHHRLGLTITIQAEKLEHWRTC